MILQVEVLGGHAFEGSVEVRRSLSLSDAIISFRISDRHYSSIGAVVTVSALAIDPFAQQITSYCIRDLAAEDNSTVTVD